MLDTPPAVVDRQGSGRKIFQAYEALDLGHALKVCSRMQEIKEGKRVHRAPKE